ncbi:MAG: HNH endonuclease [Spirochaetales bacterium]|nr:HNH endonuclease [Calditrichota bacterium]MBN2657178.1 HNH endonuclease [Spirochaetales bacterium]
MGLFSKPINCPQPFIGKWVNESIIASLNFDSVTIYQQGKEIEIYRKILGRNTQGSFGLFSKASGKFYYTSFFAMGPRIGFDTLRLKILESPFPFTSEMGFMKAKTLLEEELHEYTTYTASNKEEISEREESGESVYIDHYSEPLYAENVQSNFEEMKNRRNKQCSRCGSRQSVQVHHLTPVQFGGTDEKSNLIYLCKECHEKEHGYEFGNEKKNLTNRKPLEKPAMINQAINEGKMLKIKYYSPKYRDKPAETTERIVRPIELYKKEYRSNYSSGFHMTLRAFCTLRNGERNFQIRRIEEMRIVD